MIQCKILIIAAEVFLFLNFAYIVYEIALYPHVSFSKDAFRTICSLSTSKNFSNMICARITLALSQNSICFLNIFKTRN